MLLFVRFSLFLRFWIFQLTDSFSVIIPLNFAFFSLLLIFHTEIVAWDSYSIIILYLFIILFCTNKFLLAFTFHVHYVMHVVLFKV